MKQLKFIHITKTGGSSIEKIGLKNNIKWGVYDKEYSNNSGRWHLIFGKVRKEIKEKYDWFLVCRNPYERILSEYYCVWGGIGKEKIEHSKIEFNKYIRKKILSKMNYEGHYVGQNYYYDKRYKITVLRFESLKEDFENLMKKYNMNIKLDIKINVGKNKKFSINDFDNETINLINKVYKRDFILFNYKFINYKKT